MSRKTVVDRVIVGTKHTFLIELSDSHGNIFCQNALVVQVTVTPPLASSRKIEITPEGVARSTNRSVLDHSAEQRGKAAWVKDALYATWGIDNPSSLEALTADRQALRRVVTAGVNIDGP